MTGIINNSLKNVNDTDGFQDMECEYLKANSGGYTKT